MIRSSFILLAAALVLLAPPSAHADFRIVSPYEIDFGELEIEHNGSTTVDRRRDVGGAASYTSEFGTGLTPWWHSEVEFDFDRDADPDEPILLTQVVLENTFQLTEPGEEVADFAFYIEYGQSATRGRYAAANQVTFGPVVAKDVGRTTQTLNLFFTRLLGPDQTTRGYDMTYAWQSRWNVWRPLSPALEVYGDTGIVGQMPGFSQQQFLVGPVAVGSLGLNEVNLGHAGKLKYEVGWLFGATPATSAGTLRWRMEVEIPF